MNDIVFCGDNGQLITTSQKVAEIFGKEHNKVVRDIESISCSDDFRAANFGVLQNQRSLPKGGYKEERYYTMTKDGFTFLVMGYRGAKASQFKESYIEAFNKMEQAVKVPQVLPYAIDNSILQQLVETTQVMAAQLHQMQLVLNKRSKSALPKRIKPVLLSDFGEKRIFPRQYRYYTVNQIAKSYNVTPKSLNSFLAVEEIQRWDEQRQRWVLFDDLQEYDLTYAVVYDPLDTNEEAHEYMVWTPEGRTYLTKYISEAAKGEDFRLPLPF